MNFLFEITPDYLFGYNGTEVFRAKVWYGISKHNGIIDPQIRMPLECLPYIINSVKLAEDIWKATLKHAETSIPDFLTCDKLK